MKHLNCFYLIYFLVLFFCFSKIENKVLNNGIVRESLLLKIRSKRKKRVVYKKVANGNNGIIHKLAHCFCFLQSRSNVQKWKFENRNENMKKKEYFLRGNCFDYPSFAFHILKEHNKDGDRSRIGIIKTPRGEIETPNFLFCATKGCIKSTPIDFLKALNVQVILSNTFHLLIQPKPHVIFQFGGLHKYMNWEKPILTDSGGYQIFSMAHGSVSKEIKRNYGGKYVEKNKKSAVERGRENKERSKDKSCIIKISEEGALYKSYFDGSTNLLSPEISIQAQYMLGSDFILVLDECTPFHVDKTYTEMSMHRSHRWYIRSLLEFYKANTMENYHEYLKNIYSNYKYNGKEQTNGIENMKKDEDKRNIFSLEQREKNKQALYGIIQGGVFDDLRKKSCDFVNQLPFFGICIGGCLGNNKDMMYKVIKTTMNYLSERNNIESSKTGSNGKGTKKKPKPIHLLGIGQIEDIFFGVRNGIDTFDCVIPSRLARHGYFLSSIETIKSIEKQINRKIKHEYVKIKLHIFHLDNRPLENDCNCYTCVNYSRAYLHHLFKINDNLLGTLLTIHNVSYMQRLMTDIRYAIREDRLNHIREKWVR